MSDVTGTGPTPEERIEYALLWDETQQTLKMSFGTPQGVYNYVETMIMPIFAQFNAPIPHYTVIKRTTMVTVGEWESNDEVV